MSRVFRTIGATAVAVITTLAVSPMANAAPNTVTTLDGFFSASGVAFSPDGALAYVVSNDVGTLGGLAGVTVVDTRTLTTVSDFISSGVVSAGVNTAIAMAPDGTKAYVGLGAGVVKPFSPATLTFGPPITVGAGGVGQIVFSPDGTKAYVAVSGNGSGQSVVVLDVATDTVVVTIPVCQGPSGMAITPEGTRVFANCGDGSVNVIETAGNTVLTSFTPTGHLQGTSITIAPDGASVWVGAFAGGGSSTYTSVVDTTTYSTLHQFTGESKGVAFSQDGSTAHILDVALGELIPVNTTTFAEGTPLTVMEPSSGFWFMLDKNPAAEQIFVTGRTSVIVVGDGPPLPTNLPDTGLSTETTTALAVVALVAALGGALLISRRRRA
jgi:LPXTG-motif cell wall-anchored protein